MDSEQFTSVVDRQMSKSIDILVVKAKEYASDTDRLANFKVAAALQSVTTRQALAGMMAKHTYSVFEMCRSDKTFTDEQWDEKLTDHINYLLLLKAVTVEENAPQYELVSVNVEPGAYKYMTTTECIKSGEHLTEVDNDGYCMFCGWQYTTPPSEPSVEKAQISYDQYADAADNRSKVKRLETILKADLTPDEALSQAVNVIFP